MERLIQSLKDFVDVFRNFFSLVKGLDREQVMRKDKSNVPILLVTLILIVVVVGIFGYSILKLF